MYMHRITSKSLEIGVVKDPAVGVLEKATLRIFYTYLILARVRHVKILDALFVLIALPSCRLSCCLALSRIA